MIERNPNPAGIPGVPTYDIGDRPPDLDGGDSDGAPDDELDEDRSSPSLDLHVAERSPREKYWEGHASITANEWAFLKYRADLTGDPRKYQPH